MHHTRAISSKSSTKHSKHVQTVRPVPCHKFNVNKSRPAMVIVVMCCVCVNNKVKSDRAWLQNTSHTCKTSNMKQQAMHMDVLPVFGRNPACSCSIDWASGHKHQFIIITTSRCVRIQKMKVRLSYCFVVECDLITMKTRTISPKSHVACIQHLQHQSQRKTYGRTFHLTPLTQHHHCINSSIAIEQDTSLSLTPTNQLQSRIHVLSVCIEPTPFQFIDLVKTKSDRSSQSHHPGLCA